MALTDANSKKISLPNELTDKDFDSFGGNWLYENFSSGYVYPKINNTESRKVAAFLADQACGPYYVHESGNQGHGGQGKILHVLLLHPEDRAYFAQQFVGGFWKEDPEAPKKNVGILLLQARNQFGYENPSMAALLQELKSVEQTLPVVPEASDVDAIARRIWTRPNKPLPNVTVTKRLPQLAAGK